MIKFKCSVCSEELEASSSLRGDVIRCPKCDVEVHVPSLHELEEKKNYEHPSYLNFENRDISLKWVSGKKNIILMLVWIILIAIICLNPPIDIWGVSVNTDEVSFVNCLLITLICGGIYFTMNRKSKKDKQDKE